MRQWLSLTVAALLLASLAACGASPGAGTGGVPSVSAGPDSPRIAAKDLKFDRVQLQLPASNAFALVFDNQEALPHNVSFSEQSGTVLFVGEVFTGPATRVYAVPALKPGTYLFKCDLHPDMKGTATAQ
jgi:plastocyanin